MTKDEVTRLLHDFRSYEYAARNCGPMPDRHMPLVISERKRNLNYWDRSRYNRIVNLIRGAVEQVLSDDQRTVITKKYLERNRMTLSEIARYLHVDPSTITRRHTEAINQLAIALSPLSEDEMEITPFDHMFERQEPLYFT